MNDPLDSIFTNSAREMWALDWRIWRAPLSTRKQRRCARNRMKKNRRQAALERALAEANRRIEELEGYIDQHDQRVMSDHDARLLEQWHERM